MIFFANAAAHWESCVSVIRSTFVVCRFIHKKNHSDKNLNRSRSNNKSRVEPGNGFDFMETGSVEINANL